VKTDPLLIPAGARYGEMREAACSRGSAMPTLDPAAPARAALMQRGADRLILLLEVPHDPERLRPAGRRLAAG
jgi:hypothetical protein